MLAHPRTDGGAGPAFPKGTLHAPRRREGMAHRMARSLSLGPAMLLQFEDEATLRHQVAEVMRAERITCALAAQREFEAYAHLLPNGRRWTATLLIQLPEAQQRARWLPLLSDAAHRVFVACDGLPRALAQANEDLADRHRGRPSGVHFLRFELPGTMRAALLAGRPCVLGCAHDGYAWQRALPSPLLALLRGDLTASPVDDACAA